MMSDRYCNDCRELQGYRRVRRPDGRGGTYEALAVCEHANSMGAGFQPIGPSLRRVIGSLKPPDGSILRSLDQQIACAEAALTPADKKIAALIQARVGRANAIRGRDLAAAVWPEEMADRAKYESAVRRWLEDSVSRLRRFARLPIAASKSNPMGYYIPATAQECDEVHDRLFNEGIERIKDSQLFRPDRDLAERLRGQLELRESAVGTRESEVRNRKSTERREAEAR
jgi:hypothetical protein